MTDHLTEELKAEYLASAADMKRAQQEIHKVIYGQEEIVKNVLTCMAAGGHALLMGPPGLAKTLLVNTLGSVMGLQAKRIQFTPDLMPSDIIGSEVMEQDENGKRHFRFIPGPIFTQLLLADEINRASPRTQAALLQAMQEGFVTVNGINYPLPQPFIVLATQNPLEQEGTYPLPEAQRDRFLMQIDVGYPDAESEKKITAGAKARKYRKSFEEMNPGLKPPSEVVDQIKPSFNANAVKLEQVMNPEKLLRIQELLDIMPVNEEIVDHITKIVRSGRPDDPTATEKVRQFVEWAPGPRADEALMLTSEARALIDGRTSPSKQDVLDVLDPVMKHRMALHYGAKAKKVDLKDVIATMRP